MKDDFGDEEEAQSFGYKRFGVCRGKHPCILRCITVTVTCPNKYHMAIPSPS
ncbi:hypothetical protein CRENBAI_019722 [Crenichthys baileyi]|uniref:Uncharacterized protein n=1 Tax=Crenichthys baileyi TaxID=28760 RepID=A0AAV9QSL7_9TELE